MPKEKKPSAAKAKEDKSAKAEAKVEKVKKEKPEVKKEEKAEKPIEEKKEVKTEPTAEKTAPKAKSGKSSRRAGTPKKKKVVLNFDRGKTYPIDQAVKLAKENSHEKFDASVDVHFHLGIDTAKGEQQVRGTVALPHGVGKTVRIVAFVEPIKEAEALAAGADFIGNDEFIAKIKKTEKTDFDLAIAEPSVMRKLGVIAKILGTRGLMPSPKNDTVTPDPIKAIAEFKKGKLSFKNDDTGNLHITI
ncbi:MAG: hypothetical protein PHE24_01590, partial [Patescibacteria group bacterium]|nr:hypothetical protein [Patescibacteria group bacterium]